MSKKKKETGGNPPADAPVGMDAKVERVARLCHEANRGYCEALGDTSQVPWDEAPENIKASAIAGVKFHAANPDASPASSHESWLLFKKADGWKYGPVKDADKKEHPCIVWFDELPVEQRAKDYIFRAICHEASVEMFMRPPEDDTLAEAIVKAGEDAAEEIQDLRKERAIKDSEDPSTGRPGSALQGFIPRISEFELAGGGKVSVEAYRVMAVVSDEDPHEPGKAETCRLILHGGRGFDVIGKGDEVRKDVGHV